DENAVREHADGLNELLDHLGLKLRGGPPVQLAHRVEGGNRARVYTEWPYVYSSVCFRRDNHVSASPVRSRLSIMGLTADSSRCTSSAPPARSFSIVLTSALDALLYASRARGASVF